MGIAGLSQDLKDPTFEVKDRTKNLLALLGAVKRAQDGLRLTSQQGKSPCKDIYMEAPCCSLSLTSRVIHTPYCMCQSNLPFARRVQPWH